MQGSQSDCHRNCDETDRSFSIIQHNKGDSLHDGKNQFTILHDDTSVNGTENKESLAIIDSCIQRSMCFMAGLEWSFVIKEGGEKQLSLYALKQAEISFEI